MNHLGTKVLETERLLLRPFTMDDAPAMFVNWATDPAVTKYLTWQPHADLDATKAILKDWVSSYEKEDYYHWAIVLKSLGEPVGSIGTVAKRDDIIKMVHMGYCLGSKWWRQGIMSEALGRLIKFFFEEVGVTRVEARFDTRNVNSGKVMAKCGMLYEGTMRQDDVNNQGVCDAAYYAILAEDYFKK